MHPPYAGVSRAGTEREACALLRGNMSAEGAAELLHCLAGTQPNLRDGHLFSLFLMLPLAYVTLALLLFNWYPSQVGHSHARAVSCKQ